jgi:D-alanine-D-alanine ligase
MAVTSRRRKSRSSRIKAKKTVLVLVDEEAIDATDPQFRRAVDEKSYMEHHVIKGLRQAGYRADVFGFSDGSIENLLARVDRDKPLVAFNLVEHLRTDRLMSPDIPALLELLDIPYTGCGSVGMSLALDKGGSKQLLLDKKLGVPRFVVVAKGAAYPKDSLRFPVIVKPRFGGGSEGISLASVTHDHRQIEARLRFIHRQLRQPAICEEFIAGREFSVAVLGNGSKAFALPVRETVFGSADKGGPSFATQAVKGDERYRERWKISYGKAAIGEALERRLRAFGVAAYRTLEMRGYARIDIRHSADGRLFFLEANSNPDLSPRFFGLMAEWVGVAYPQLLQRIIGFALERRRARH